MIGWCGWGGHCRFWAAPSPAACVCLNHYPVIASIYHYRNTFNGSLEHGRAAPQVRWDANVKNGVCGLQFDRADIKMNKFVAACLESQMHVYDARTQHPQKVGLRARGRRAGKGVSLARRGRLLRERSRRLRGACGPHATFAGVSTAACPPPFSLQTRLPQGFAGMTQKLARGTTVWGAAHLPQNRDVLMAHSGDGEVMLFRYRYPDQRKVKVGGARQGSA